MNEMNEIKKKYEAPALTVVNLRVERGYALSSSIESRSSGDAWGYDNGIGIESRSGGGWGNDGSVGIEGRSGSGWGYDAGTGIEDRGDGGSWW